MENNNQIEMISLEQLIGAEHIYRKMYASTDIAGLCKAAKVKSYNMGADGFGAERLLKCLLLQFVEDLSDRNMERFMNENIAAKWFCGFTLSEKTPTFSSFCKFRNSVGVKRIEAMFTKMKEQLAAKNLTLGMFTFIDATSLISKMNLWEERDLAVSAGYEKLNNEVLPKIKNSEERIGAKTSKKFWYGFKKSVAVDMNSGMIMDVAVTMANVTDAEAGKLVLPKTGAVCADKGYVGLIPLVKEKGLHPMILKRNNMKDKNADLDKYISKLRAPYENTFARQRKKVRFKTILKNQLAEFLYAISFNMKRLTVI